MPGCFCSSGAANDYGKQIFATPRYESKTSSLSQTETACSDVLSRSDKQGQFGKKKLMSLMQHEEMERKIKINTYSDDRKNFVVKGTTIQGRLIQILF